MRVFIYEHITGGGTLAEPGAQMPARCLMTEGAAMLRALVSDFAAVAKVDVCTLRDARLAGISLPRCAVRTVKTTAEYERAFPQLVADCDATLLVAPELGGSLLTCCRRMAVAGANLISPGELAVALASDKYRLSCCLARSGIPVPRFCFVRSGETLPAEFPYPAILKPNDGAGSVSVHLVTSSEAWNWEVPCRHPGWLLQAYHRGAPASVALIGDRSEPHALIPCRQRISRDGRFRYLGGQLPLPPRLAERAVRLAIHAVRTALPGVVGYLGVDLVLGDDPGGRDDVVIEVNPRLTTSYVGLRAAAESNLAAAMLAAANGHQPDLRFRDETLEFGADGAVDRT